MTMRHCFTLMTCLICSISWAQVPPVGYATNFGGIGNDGGWGIAVDALGNTYTGGYFGNSITSGSTTITSNGDLDFFVAKHNDQGDVVWAKNFGWVLQDMAFTITADASGNSYIAARWFNRITVDGNTYYATDDGKDICVIKLDTDGNVVWFSAFGGTGTDTPNDIAVDASGNVFLTGQFVDDFTFNGQTVTVNGSDDVFVVKLDANGNHDWLSTFGSTFGDIGRSIAVDGNGNCYVAGNARGSMQVGTVTLNCQGTDYDAFLVKYNSAGTAQWAENIGGSNADYAYGLAADAAGNTYITGNFTGSSMIGSISLTGNGTLYTDGFIAKFNTAGVAQWAHAVGGSDSDASYDVDVDINGNSYFIGQFRTNITIDGTTLSNAGSSDVFITKVDALGNFDWSTSIGGTGADLGYGIASHNNGNVYAVGFYTGSMTVGSTTLIANGGYDVYTVRLGNAMVTGIEDASDNGTLMEELGRYNLLGQPVEKESKALQIIQYKDGSYKKLLRFH